MKRLVRKSTLNKLAGWVSVENERALAVGDYGAGDDSKETYFQKGILTLDTLTNATGFNGEQRQWTEGRYGPGKYFGLYKEEDWYEFLEDIKANGIKEPVQLQMNSDGSLYIWEGNHRVEAAKQLGLTEIPAKVYYMGQSQQEHKIM